MGEYTDVIDDETYGLMTEQFHEGEKLVDEQLAELKLTNPNADEAIPVTDVNFFGVNEQKMQALMNDITALEKRVETAALRMTDDVYRQTVNRVQLAMATGSMSLNQVIDIATKDFLSQGINCIVYADGKRVNIADYVRMALRTTSTRATLQGRAKRFAESGYDTVMTSQHGSCSETCLPYQGKVYIDDVFTPWHGEVNGDYGKSNYCGKWFMLLSVAIKGGLFHPNCRHPLLQYIDGITEIPEPIPAEKIKQQRELEQKQRYLERKIRKFKRFQMGSCDPETVKAYGRKVKETQAELRKLIKANESFLKRDYGREKVYDGEVDKLTNRDIINLEIQKGNISLTINPEKQARHLLGSGYIKGRSYLNISEKQVQQLVNQKYGTGVLVFDESGNWKHKEVIESAEDIGVCVNKNGSQSNTNRFTVHYSKTGTHVVPTKRGGDKND